MSMEVGASDHLSILGRRLVMPAGMTVSEAVPGGGDVTIANGGSLPVVTSAITRNGYGEIASYTQNGITVTATRNAFGVIQTVSDGITTRTVAHDGFGQITGVS